MQLVQTSVGLIDLSALEVRDITSYEQNAKVIATEWFLNGTLVRRDVNVNILNGIDLTSSQENM